MCGSAWATATVIGVPGRGDGAQMVLEVGAQLIGLVGTRRNEVDLDRRPLLALVPGHDRDGIQDAAVAASDRLEVRQGDRPAEGQSGIRRRLADVGASVAIIAAESRERIEGAADAFHGPGELADRAGWRARRARAMAILRANVARPARQRLAVPEAAEGHLGLAVDRLADRVDLVLGAGQEQALDLAPAHAGDPDLERAVRPVAVPGAGR